jgi:hypothetical protein
MSEYVLVTPEGKTYSKSTINRYFTIAKTNRLYHSLLPVS